MDKPTLCSFYTTLIGVANITWSSDGAVQNQNSLGWNIRNCSLPAPLISRIFHVPMCWNCRAWRISFLIDPSYLGMPYLTTASQSLAGRCLNCKDTSDDQYYATSTFLNAVFSNHLMYNIPQQMRRRILNAKSTKESIKFYHFLYILRFSKIQQTETVKLDSAICSVFSP